MKTHLPIEWDNPNIVYQYYLAPTPIGSSPKFSFGTMPFVNYNSTVDFSSENQTLGCIIGAAGTAGASVLAFPEDAPLLPSLAVATLSGITSYKLSLASPPPPELEYAKANTETLLADYNIDAGKASPDTYLALTSNGNRLDPVLFKILQSCGNMTNWINNGFNNQWLNMSFSLYHRPVRNVYVGDAYGADGYDGTVEGDVDVATTLYTVDHWTYTPGTYHNK